MVKHKQTEQETVEVEELPVVPEDLAKQDDPAETVPVALVELPGALPGAEVFDPQLTVPTEASAPTWSDAQSDAQIEDTLPALVTQGDEPEPAAETVGAAVFTAPTDPPVQPATAPAAPAAPDAPARAPFAPTRWEFFGLVVGASLLTLLVSLALNLGFLALINGGLGFVRTGDYDRLSRQVDSLQTEAASLRQDLASAETRLETLQGVTTRVGAVEQETEALRGLVDARQRELNTLTTQIEGLDEEVSALAEQSSGFSSFLDGLRDLLNVPGATR